MFWKGMINDFFVSLQTIIPEIFIRMPKQILITNNKKAKQCQN